MFAPRASTLVVDAVWGHRDRFRGGEVAYDNMENKFAVCMGESVPGVYLDSLPPSAPPIASLVYPRWRCATLLTPGVLEFHALGDVVHCAPSPADWWQSVGMPPPADSLLDLRGAWDDEGRLYQYGFAVTDWWEYMNAQQRQSYYRRQRARQRAAAG